MFRSDPTRLFITFGASLSLCDNRHRNTALHWAVFSRNSTAVSLLLRAGANIHAKNGAGDTPLDMAKRLNIVWITHRLQESYNKERVLTSCNLFGKQIRIPSIKDKSFRLWLMYGSPFILYLLLGQVFDSELTFAVKTILFLILCLICYTLVRFIFDDRMYNILPISIYLSTKFWLYVTFITYYFQSIFKLNKILCF